MNRREFVGAVAASLLTTPLSATAQQPGRVWRIGVLGLSPTTADMVGPDPKNAFVNALLGGLRGLGYAYGQHYVTEPRGAEGRVERYPDLVADLLRLKVDVIVAVGASLVAVKQATSTTPVVFPGTEDPVGQGYAESLARPGRNFTGLSFQSLELVAKRLELLKEIVPTGGPVAVLWDHAKPLSWESAAAAARERGWKLLSLPIRDVNEIDEALRVATTARAEALLAAAGMALDPNPQRVVDLAAKHRLPAMYHFRYYVQRGGLAYYGPDLLEMWRSAAVFVDKILKGAKPRDLPVEQPKKYELVVNLKTAKVLGLTIPQSLLQRTDEMIQ